MWLPNAGVTSYELYRSLKELADYPYEVKVGMPHRLAFHCYLRGISLSPGIKALWVEIIVGLPSFPQYKFNPYHDDRGRFTFGPGGTEDDSNTSDNGTDNSTTADKIGHFLRWVATIVGTAHAASTEDDETGRVEDENDPLAGARSAAYQSAISTLRQLDPNSRELESISGPDWVPSQQDIDRINQAISAASYQRVMNFSMPNGEQVGEQGDGEDVRLLTGGLPAAERDFEYLTVGGTVIDLPSYRGIMKSLPGNYGLIGLRPQSSSDLPAIDFNLDAVPFEKIHYR